MTLLRAWSSRRAFAAFDLVRTTSGEHYFLEANANGEWGWLTDVVDVPIAASLAELLLSEGLS